MLADFTSTVIFLFSARNSAAPQDKFSSVEEKSYSGEEKLAIAYIGEKCARLCGRFYPYVV